MAQRFEPASSDVAVRQKERILAALDGRVAAAKEARQATIARLDGDIAVLETRAQRLRTEIDEDRRALDPRGRPPINVPGTGRPPRPDRPPAGRVGPSVAEIKGVGNAYRERLEAEGIRTAAEVAKMKPAALAAALSISEERAKALVAEAKKVKK